jgi:hypothetical protein
MSSKVDQENDENQIAFTAKYWRFWILVAGILFFFGCHNYLQELIMSLEGFKVNTPF